MTFTNMQQVKRANKASGSHWFSPGALRFFKSRVSSVLHGGRFFVSSECGPSGVRLYSVREVAPNGGVSTVGEFQAFATHKAAMRRAAFLATE